MPLTPEQVKIVKSTVPVLEQHGETITTVFYKNMLADYPDLNNIFNTTNQINGHQPRALAASVYAYAKYIDDLGVLSPAVEHICQKHASLYIRPEQYDIVGEYLLKAMGQVLGDALTPEILEAWGVAYWQLAEIMKKREAELLDASEGWTDWRKFTITQRVQESSEICSFYLEPTSQADSEDEPTKLPMYQPGQYISVRMPVPHLEYLQARQYSLSDAPGNYYYRISVKRERKVLDPKDVPDAKYEPGYLSNVLHDSKKVGDVIEVSHPAGEFFFDLQKVDNPDECFPVVLISAGVGLTPMISILNTLTRHDAPTARSISFIHAARNTAVRAFGQHIKALTRSHSNVDSVIFIRNITEDDVQGEDYHQQGRMSLDKLDKTQQLFLNDSKTQYYVCGPGQFMTDMEDKLKSFGVDGGRINMELFGTGGLPQ
jgi:nitric oxide dioxygenase